MKSHNGEQPRVTAAVLLACGSRDNRPVFGRTAAGRLVRMLSQAGLAVHVLSDSRTPGDDISASVPAQAVHVIENGDMLAPFVGMLGLCDKESVMVLQADHIIDRTSLRRLIDNATGDETCCLHAADRPHTDGIFVVTAPRLAALLRALWSGTAEAARDVGPVRSRTGQAGMPLRMGSPGAQGTAPEDSLVRALAEQTSDDDGFFARHIDRHISRAVSSRLARTFVTPNLITVGGVTIGLLGAWLLSRPGYWPQLAGALLFLICIVVDGMDGEVARLKLLESNFGHYFDVITDNIVHAAIFIAIGFGCWRATGQAVYLQALWAMLGGFVLCLIAVYQCILRKSPQELQAAPRMMRLMALMSNRDFAYLLVVLALFGRLGWFLFGAAAGTYLFAAALWYLHTAGKRTPARTA